jgi:uncharacterized membrane protein
MAVRRSRAGSCLMPFCMPLWLLSVFVLLPFCLIERSRDRERERKRERDRERERERERDGEIDEVNERQ